MFEDKSFKGPCSRQRGVPCELLSSIGILQGARFLTGFFEILIAISVDYRDRALRTANVSGRLRAQHGLDNFRNAPEIDLAAPHLRKFFYNDNLFREGYVGKLLGHLF